MDAVRFDVIVRALGSHRSRRNATRLLAGSAFGGFLAHDAVPAAAKKKKKKKCKAPKVKCGKKCCPEGQGCLDGQCGAPPPPPPPGSTTTTTTTTTAPPPPTGPGSCGYDGTSPITSGVKRWAQTFLPPQGGQLTGVQFSVRQNPADFDFIVQIRNVDAQGIPGNSILGAETVTVATETIFPAIEDVPVTFDPPVSLEIGEPYALTISGATNGYALHLNNTGNFCADGKLFSFSEPSASFNVFGSGTADMVYTLTIVD